MPMSGVTSNASEGLSISAEMQSLGSQRYVQVTVCTAEDQPVEDWAFDIKLPSAVLGICGANYDRVGGVSYRITPDPWTRRIPAGGKVELGLLLA